MSDLSYEGLTEAELIHALYHGTHAQGMGYLHNRPGLSLADVDSDIANGYLMSKENGVIHVDYYYGRPLKVWIDTVHKAINPGLYDRDAGRDAAWTVISSALARKRAGMTTTPPPSTDEPDASTTR